MTPATTGPESMPTRRLKADATGSSASACLMASARRPANQWCSTRTIWMRKSSERSTTASASRRRENGSGSPV